jgi:small subunit ribosomal protein S6
MRRYEVMIILDSDLDEKTIAPSLETFLNVIRSDGGSVNNIDTWGKRRLAYEINHKTEGYYVVLDLEANPAAIAELDRQLNLNEAVVRTKVTRPEVVAAEAL